MTADGLGAIDPREIRRLSRDEYHRLAATGMFDDERVELLHGQLVARSPSDPSHEEAADTIDEILTAQLVGRARVRLNLSFAAGVDSEPVPDIVVVPVGSYWKDHPGTAYLVVEVARSSLRKDRDLKARLYGRVAVREYWIVDLEHACVHVMRDPDGRGDWGSRQIRRRGEILTVEAFPDVTVAVDRILPPP